MILDFNPLRDFVREKGIDYCIFNGRMYRIHRHIKPYKHKPKKFFILLPMFSVADELAKDKHARK